MPLSIARQQARLASLVAAWLLAVTVTTRTSSVAQTFSILRNFGVLTNVTGLDPSGQLVQAPDGTLYGTTASGEASLRCTIFKVQPDGSDFTVLKLFTNSLDGAILRAGLTLSGGVLYGTSSSGGSFGVGTVFKLNTDGTGFTVLKNFSTNFSGGGFPMAGLVLSGGVLYGTTTSGTVFKLNTDGTGFTVLQDLYSNAGLVLSGNTLYGTADAHPEPFGFNPGSYVFKVNTDGSGYAIVHHFGTNLHLDSGLTLSGSTLYGTISGGDGAVLTNGAIFKVNTDGTGYTELNAFAGGPDGARPFAGLALDGSTLYGATSEGGALGYGTLFALNTNGSNYTLLKSFSGSDGRRPSTTLTLSGSTLYGVSGGGTSDRGVVFKVNTNGTGYTVLKHFAYSDAAAPFWLTSSGGTLYGASEQGGESGGGTVFKLNADGTGYRILKGFGHFDSDGSELLRSGGMVLSDGTLYGTTTLGRPPPDPSVPYKVNTDGTGYKLLANDWGFGGAGGLAASRDKIYFFFEGSIGKLNSDGSGFAVLKQLVDLHYSAGPLTLLGNTLYGTYETTGGNVTVFKLNTDGTGYAVIKTLAYSEGAFSFGRLQVSHGTLYGTASGGGLGYGTVFKVNADGSGFTVLKQFSGVSDGSDPASLVLAGNMLYGTIYYGPIYDGGALNYGTVFKLNTDGTGYSTIKTFSGSDGAYPADLAFSGSSLFGTTVLGGETGAGTVFSIIDSFPPSINSQPQGLAVNAGANVVLAVGAAGTATLAYQWRKDGANLNGQTGSSLSLTGLQTSDGGDYDVMVTNAFGIVTSEAATLIVFSSGSATRSLPAAYQPGQVVAVSVRVTPPPNATSWSVVEYFPADWTVVSATDASGTNEFTGELVLGPFTNPQPRTLTYGLRSIFERDNTVTFSGQIQFGDFGAFPVSGDTNLVARRDWDFVGPQVLLGQQISGAGYGAGRWVAAAFGWATTLADGASHFTYPKGLTRYDPSYSRMAFLGTKFLWWGQDSSVNNLRMAASDDGLSWRFARGPGGSNNPDPFHPNGQVESAAYGNGAYVAVGFQSTNMASQNGTIWSSTNGYEWVEAYKLQPPLNRYLWSIAFGDGRFIAVGNSGTIVSSLDGFNWAETQNFSVTNRKLNGISWGPPGWIVTMSETFPFQTMSSVDGTNWVLASAANSPRCDHSFYADGKYWFTSSADDDSFTTSDGISWRNVGKSSVRRAPNGVSPKFLAGAQSGLSAIYGSEDATNWTLLAASGTGGRWPNLVSAAATATQWLVSSVSCLNPHIWGRPLEEISVTNLWLPELVNPISWSAGSNFDWSLSSLGLAADFIQSGDTLLAAGASIDINGAISLRAGPAQALSDMPTLPATVRNVSPRTYHGWPLNQAGWSVFRASFCKSTNRIDLYAEAATFNDPNLAGKGGHFSSLDGTNWTLRATGLNNVTNFPGITGLAWGGGRYVAVAEGTSFVDVPPSTNRIYTSTDGENFNTTGISILDSPVTEALEGVACSAGAFVAVGNQGRILYSTNGLLWGTVWASDGQGWNRVRYLNNTWWIVGNGGRAASSPDGRVWTLQSTGVQNDLNDIASLHGYYLIVGNNGMVLASTFQAPQAPRILPESLAFENGAFGFTVQTSPNVLPVIETSTDLAAWSVISLSYTIGASGQITFTDPTAGAAPHRYYRARLP